VAAAEARLAAASGAVADELLDVARHRDEAAERVASAAARRRDLEARLPELEAASAAGTGRIEEAAAARRGLEERRSQVSAMRRDVEVRAAGLTERRAVLTDRLEDVERRLAGHVEERERAMERRRRIERDALAVDRLAGVVDAHGERLGVLLARLQSLRAKQVDEVRQGGERLEALRRDRTGTASQATETRDRLQRLEVELAESSVRHEAAVEALRRELGVEPADAMGAPCPELPEGVAAAERLASAEAELAALGPVNPLALEELGALEERFRFLEEQVEDVRRARRELQGVIRAVDDEIVRLFAEAFADVNEHFQTLVATLFPGGTGRLSLTDPTELLNTGIEVEARPAGKNVRKLSLLSGGERSLVALAFLFAVFRSRPSPFYLMDEVEAALDDVNLHRFLDLLHEFRDEAQLIIVSHQKRTMEAADALYGVTMAPGGSSKVVSQKVRRDPDDRDAAAAAGGR
jgi:chromosome segregation protein